MKNFKMEEVKSNLFPSVIVAGVGRCGTTSLFRYLGTSPEIQISSKKELDFLIDFPKENSTFFAEKYSAVYPAIRTSLLRIEASPRYSLEPERVAKMIHDIMPTTKVILILREPIERLQSVYKAVQRSGNIRAGISFGQFVAFTFGKGNLVSDYDHLNARYRKALANGVYVDIIKAFENHIGCNNIHIMFLENLKENPVRELEVISKFLDIDGTSFEDMVFEVENPAIDVWSPSLYKLALKLNQLLEPLLNQTPVARSFFRRIHSALNQVDNKSIEKGVSVTRQLEQFYAQPNLDLRLHIERNYKAICVPSWLNNS